MFLLDTNLLSETDKVHPDANAMRWLAGVDEGDTYISAMSIAELRYGAERLSPGRKRRRREAWIEAVMRRFAEQTIPIDTDVANQVGKVMAATEAVGRPVRGEDALIAATALWHRLVVVTRNVKHFEHTGVEVLNPWEQPAG